MKTSRFFRRLIVTGGVVLCTAAYAFGFEGKIDMTMTSPNSTDALPVTYYMKGKRMRMEMATATKGNDKGPASFVTLMNLDTREFTMLMDEQKMYMVHKMPDVTAEKSDTEKKKTDFVATGRKETIAGIKAEEYVGQSDGRQTELWVTSELGEFMMVNQGKGRPKTSGWQNFLQGRDAFALRVIQRDSVTGPEKFRLEVTKIDRSSPDDSLFDPPAGYRKFEMPSMGDALKGLLPGTN